MSLDEVRDFYVPRCLTMAGLTSVDGTRLKPGTPRKRQRRAAAA